MNSFYSRSSGFAIFWGALSAFAEKRRVSPAVTQLSWQLK
jgi:hypothetical protein